MKYKTCRYWTAERPFKSGVCVGITPETKIVPLPPLVDKKGQLRKRGKLLVVRSGVIGCGNHITTPEDFYCKNWRKK
jgi:hypothetical protein